MRLNFYEDPGHGWLAVPLALLERLELLDSISHYSYMRGMLAHLEEDCDASLFLARARAAGLTITLRESRCPDRHSRIRNYDPFSADRARRNLANNRAATSTCPTCSHGQGFKCRTCWPVSAPQG